MARVLPIAYNSGSTEGAADLMTTTRDKNNPGSTPFWECEPDDAMEQEIAAFVTQHDTLVAKYLNQYVAFYRGKLIHHNFDQEVLLDYIEAHYPNDIVLIRKVEAELPKPLIVRSPRFIKVK